ncbi:MAG: hypothetical protein KUG75_04175 [Pseudomonadales bacterium]|nr:hypothetical protein [Pseudomonadales bacterium]
MTKQITRILFTLECDSIDQDAMRALAVFSNGNTLELTGLYVEDQDLVNAGQLPGLVEISLSSGEISKLSPLRVNRQISSQQKKIKTQFEASARNLNYNAMFKVVKGRVFEMLTEAAIDSDIVVVSRSLRHTGMRAHHGSRFEPLVSQHTNFLFINEPWRTGECIIALYDPAASNHSVTLDVARKFAEREQIELILAVPQKEISNLAETTERSIALQDWSEDSIVQLCQFKNARLLILPESKNLDWRKLLLGLIDRLQCSLLRLER